MFSQLSNGARATVRRAARQSISTTRTPIGQTSLPSQTALVLRRAAAVRAKSSTVKSWLPREEEGLKSVTRKALVYELSQVQNAVAEELVPWFTRNMPSSYFRQVDSKTQGAHLRTLSAHFDPKKSSFMQSHGRIVLQSVDPNGHNELTYMDFSGNQKGALQSQIESLPEHMGKLSRVKVFTSLDHSLCFNIYTFSGLAEGWEASGQNTFASALAADSPVEPGTSALDAGPEVILDLARRMKEAHESGAALPEGMEWSELFEEDALEAFMLRCPEKHVLHSRPRSFLRQRLLFDQVTGTENVALHAEKSAPDDDLSIKIDADEGAVPSSLASDARQSWWIRLALSNSVPQVTLARILALLNFRDVDVKRMHLDVLDDGDNGDVTMIRVLVSSPEEADARWWDELSRETKRLKWADDNTLDLAFQSASSEQGREVGVVRAEIMTALNSACHPILSKQDPFAFSKTNINAVVQHPRYLRHALGIADLFQARFDPVAPLSDTRYSAWLNTLRTDISSDVEDLVASTVLHKMVDLVEATFRTNLYMDDRYAISMRLDPRIFRPSSVGEAWNTENPVAGADFDVPYGVFFVHGRRFNGFHVRFRDIARGGMRLVTPPTTEQHAIESARHFDEAYQLASAQQLKNKDIPEGGSKCVVLVDVVDSGKKGSPVLEASSKELVVRKSVKAFTDSLLDLIVQTPETSERVIDFYGAPELLYLGPDEQVIPDDINWIVKRAGERGYPIPSAFMSSKPDAGINHKEFGVTSEGVQVFLDVALGEMGMHPLDESRDKPVTIKMTGGPDGDVAGNMIKILNREYGEKVKIVGICDHSGSAEDPNGLDSTELMRLVTEELAIENFDATKLSAEGAVHLVDTDEGIRARNTMHNRVVADAFIPAGGRPSTINEDNWRAFLLPSGEPSAKLVVEGANLFITPVARQRLFDECRLPIVKDSSANKCGVICSSYEIMSSMLLSEEEFGQSKKEIVGDVLTRLRDLARREAKLLFAEFHKYPGALPKFSMKISDAINRVTDSIATALAENSVHKGDSQQAAALRALINEHLPAKLDELAADRLHERVPEEYIKYAISSSLASRIVYREGCNFIEEQDNEHLAQLAFDYLDAETKVDDVVSAVEGASWSDDTLKEEAVRMIRHGGIRAHLMQLNAAEESD